MCDTNGDGKIDYLEFVQAAIDHKALLNKQNMQDVFKMLDSNGDGNISMNELKENFAGNISNGDCMFESIIKEVDTNNDG
jgi:calcium-dependent protein kinase